ncbi:aromatic ring-hydroxylating oxygenase subunit alpha [Sphingomonas sp. GB1N7]|uniref:aromatic ring-hydroxylating oxygenase subunit alpha n=1 Tax=Parasphingomonas caseinilytica TaxID=3096158 RepID=UPI002FC60834
MADRDPNLSGSNRSPGISWEQLMDIDGRPVPEFLRTESYEYRGSDPIPASRYTSAEFAAEEAAKLWPHVWQFAAREEDLPEAGDYIVYENAGRSYLVSRQEDGGVRAFHNVCLHRGRKLRTADGSADQFQCPFHGFTWNKDGSFAQMPCKWDFAHLRDEDLLLPEAEVGRWGGYIFLRETPGGPTLEEFLAPLPEHFKRWRHEECTTAIWVGKVVPANWKVTMEAFMEAWHTVVTHPQLLAFTGDCNSAYWTWGDNVNVNLVPFGIMSPHLDAEGREQQWIVDEFIKFNGRSAENYEAAGDPFAVKVPDGSTARLALGEAMRENYSKMFGHDHSQATDSELLDGLVYNVFPNFAPWGGFMPNIVYRWRPWGDVDHCLMEVRILTRVPPGQPIPRGATMRFLSDDEPWTACAEIGVLGDVFEQDMENLPFVQQGLKASKTGQVNLANYQEIRLRQFHQTLDKYLAAER